MKLKPNSWKKVHEDTDHTILKSDQGHEIKLVHKLLKPEHANELKALTLHKMADGGQVKFSNGQEEQNAKDMSKGANQSGGLDIVGGIKENWNRITSPTPQPENKAHGGVLNRSNPKLDESKKLPHYNQGTGDVSSQPDPNADIAQAASSSDQTAAPIVAPQAADPTADMLSQKRSLYNTLVTGSQDPAAAKNMSGAVFGPNGEAPSNFDPNTWQNAEKLFATRASNQNAEAMQNAAAVQQDNQSRVAAGIAPLPAAVAAAKNPPGSDAGGPAPAGTTDISAGTPNAASDSMGMGAYGAGLDQAFGEQKQGAQQEAAAIGAEGKQEQASLSQQQVVQQQQANNYEQHYNALDQERKNFQDDLQNQHIDPNQYLSNMDVGGKISTGIGLILGGMGGGLTHQGNPALDFLNKQIDRNIEGQKLELGKKENLLSANLKQFGNLRDATDMTRIMNNDILVNKLKQAAAGAMGPIAAARALQASGQFDVQSAQLHMQMAMRQTMMSAVGGTETDPNKAVQKVAMLRAMGHNDMANDLQSKIVPGIGMAQKPVPEDVLKQITSSKQVNDLMNQSLEFSRQNAGNFDPRVLSRGSVLQNQLIGAVKNAQHDGVYKESEANFLTKQIGGNPASFMAAISSVPKIQEMQSIKQHEYGRLLDTYGIRGSNTSLPGQPQQAAAPQYKTVNGVKYMRGPDGKAVPVK